MGALASEQYAAFFASCAAYTAIPWALALTWLRQRDVTTHG